MSMVGVGGRPKKADVGRIRKMSKDEAPKPPRDESQPLPTPSSYGRVISNIGGRRPYRPGSAIFAPAVPATASSVVRDVSGATRPGANTLLGAGLAMRDGTRTGGIPMASAGGTYVTPFEQWAAGEMGGGGGGGRPDLSAYRAALTNQANQINAQIQAMYRALGEEAAANLGRIQNVYGGAQAGVGDVYGSATQNIQQAFGSAQQQAADQLARLGIEAAAPTVIDPMALSQAEAVAGLEQGRAGGLSALGRYGATAQDFASQMAQVAQQQGTEMNAAILASLQNRLMDTLAAEQSGGGGGGRGMSVRDRAALREQYNQEVLGLPSLEEREFALRQAEVLAEPELQRQQANRELFLSLVLPQRPGQKPIMTEQEAEAVIRAVESRGY